ncbi:hypothetical protein OWR29_17430 [Actinoplanes sp. Pm04-4]|uniref:Uncharacterized protein n=1 Tax=Paractinoplanes pyxinae TaxID=2997416 RepID=A0ABT4AZW8_9ACTN|nr:hypothetical protein [Actinoplanes pyxinae]MCY1139786.1 hypothetical protein [Actinoplanes pyxinae]
MNRLTRRSRGTPPADPAPDWGTRIKDLAALIAPTTAITALLIYFGYVGTRARFAYFGVNLDLTEMSNQSLILYGLEVIYVPAAVSLVVVLVAAICHALISRLVHAAGRSWTALGFAGVAAVAGLLLLARGVIGLLIFRVSQSERPLTSPLTLAVGPVLILYAAWAAGTVLARGEKSFARWYQGAGMIRLRRFVAATVAGLVLVALFWAANGFAGAFGSGRAVQDALDLPGEPEVVLDTREQLIDVPAGITEAPLPGKEFRYRYRGLRLLLAAGDRLFLTPAHWTTESRTLVVPYDDQVRLQLDP